MPEFKKEDIIMCPDIHTLVIAAPGSNMVLGIGYESYNLKMDLSMGELMVKEVKKMVCLGEKAFAIGYLDTNNLFKIATFFTGKMPFADNRLHSILEFAEIGTYKDFIGSEADGYVFFNVHSTDSQKHQFKALNLNGPDLYTRSNDRSVVNDGELKTGNGNNNENFNMKLNFIVQRVQAVASSRTKKTPIPLNKAVDIETSCLVEGPAFDWELTPNAPATVTPRVSAFTEFVPQKFNDTVFFNYATQVSNLGDVTFGLMQAKDSSVVYVKHQTATVTPFVVVLKERCDQMHMMRSPANNLVGVFSCLFNNEPRFYLYEFSATDGNIIYKRYSSVSKRSQIVDAVQAQGSNYILASIDERKVLQIWKFDMSSDTDGNGRTNFV